MIVGYHIIIEMYGFMLTNDSRASWSQFVGSWELYRYGRITKFIQRRSLVYNEIDSSCRLSTKQKLRYPPVLLTGVQARAVGRGFAAYFDSSQFPAWACAILPDHIHLVVGRGGYDLEVLVNGLKGQATRVLKEEGIHPLSAFDRGNGRVPKCFTRGAWASCLDKKNIFEAIKYVEEIPVKEGLPQQRWSFVTVPKIVEKSDSHS